MLPLERLIAQAQADAAIAAPEAEVQRVLQICNACRYCEGFCGVFPAMTRRLSFPLGDVHYLANLCHHCGACLHACQYAPPHEFGVNVPQAMARVRGRTYALHAWPAPLGRLYERQGATLAMALVIGLALVLALALWRHGGIAALWYAPGAGGFYEVLPHGLMVGLFAPVFGFALLALGIGVARFWRGALPQARGAGADAAAEALRDVLRLKHLDGGHGQGCPNDDDAWTLARRRWHQATFYGFSLCFAATAVATLYHYGLGVPAPYGWSSLPKVLGLTGGVALLAGCAGLWRLSRRRHPQHAVPEQRAMDRGFVALLALTSASGLLLAVARATPAVPLLLCLHLGAVLALFLTLPYGKFAHGVYRGAALLKWSIEKRQPLALRLGGE